MTVNGRLTRIEWVLAAADVELQQGVPEAWLKRDSDGQLIGPPPDANPAQLRTYEQLAAMLDSVSAPPLQYYVEPPSTT